MIPGEYLTSEKPITAHVDKCTISLSVRNTGDRPIQVGSHTHFFEVNKALDFARKLSYGYHLNIASGTSIRFEPGETKEIKLVEFGGKKIVYGFSGLVNGNLKEKQEQAFTKSIEQEFQGIIK